MVFSSAEPVNCTEQDIEQVETRVEAMNGKEHSRAEIMKLVEIKRRHSFLPPAKALGFP